MATTVSRVRSETLRTLPDDNVRQILWRFADRYDLQMLVQSAREAARGPVRPDKPGVGPVRGRDG